MTARQQQAFPAFAGVKQNALRTEMIRKPE